MSKVVNRLWGPLERWSPLVFLLAGALLAVATVAIGFELFTSMDGLTSGPAGLAGFIGIAVSYFGLLGLYPRLVDRTPRLARASVSLLLIPVVLIVVDVTALVLNATPPMGQFGSAGFMTILVLFAVGIALAAIASLRTEVPSRSVGVALFVFALSWFGQVGAAQVYGFPIPDVPNGVFTGMMTLSLLTIGYLLLIEPEPSDRSKPASDSAV
jgi:hypothetical protein